MNNKYKSSAELKALAKEHLLGKYGTIISATVIAAIITELFSYFCTALIDLDTIAGIILNSVIVFVITVLFGLFESGITYLCLKLSCSRPVEISDTFYGFKLFPDKALLIQLYRSVWICIVGLWPINILNYLVQKNPQNSVLILIYSLTAILCGVVIIMASIIYSQAFFLLHDFPEYSVKELLSLSRKLMRGNKGRFFYLIVSFIPLFLLGILSCGIAFLWLTPYICVTETEFFLDLIKNSEITQ